ncbi:fumarylacetoacetate hydrolase family protein [Bacteroidota bacterium]
MKSVKIKNSSDNWPVGKIVCVGRNYAAHANELGNDVPKEPLIFLKTATCLIDSGENIVHPPYSNDMHHEVELVLLIGRMLKDASDEEADNAVAAYAVGLDMTLRDLQTEYKSKGNPWTLSKVFDTSAVVSEFKLRKEYQLKGCESIYLKVNENTRQSSSLDKMIFSPAVIVKYVSSKMTLEKGDLIFTGTPEGVSRVRKGDFLSGGIEGIGIVETKVI